MHPDQAAPGGSGTAVPSPSPALALAMLRLDSRRPAAWLAGGAALACGVSGATLAAPVPMVVAAGGLVAVAAIGHVPARGLAGPGRWSGSWLRLFLTGIRVVWPVAGFMLAATGAAARGGSAAAPFAGAVIASCTALVFGLLHRAGGGETTAASRTLIVVGGAAAAALAARFSGSGPLGQTVAAGVAGALSAAPGVLVHATPASADFGTGSHGRRRRTEPAAGPAMVSALAAMVTCYFLAPQFAWAYAAVAVGWFVAIAVPLATAPPGGVSGARLRRGSAGRPAVPGSLRRAGATVALAAALLAWPALVALVLPAAEGDRVGGPLVAIAWLGGVAGLLVVVVMLASPAGRTEDARSLVLSLVAFAGISAGRESPGLPIFPRLSPSASEVPAGSGVEPDGVFLQNSPVAAVDTAFCAVPACVE